MRPVRYDAEIGGGNLQMDKQSWDLEHAEEAWDQWEIHCLILLSLSLQVLLFVMADLRRRSASRLLSNVLWLAYLSADTVAVFVLGHLAVHAQGPSHELMLFWAPFLLVHLGGQDTITAFSKQDNELWTRHLLGLVTQTAVTGYVVSKSSWTDTRLRAAMILMFLCGFLKYASRTFCLFAASPKYLRATSINRLSLEQWNVNELHQQRTEPEDAPTNGEIRSSRIYKPVQKRFKLMFLAEKWWKFVMINDLESEVDDIMLVDTPVDEEAKVILADELPDMLKDFKDRQDRCIAYQYVATCLSHSYQFLYTKATLLILLNRAVPPCCSGPIEMLIFCIPFALTYTLFQCISTVIALVLFASSQNSVGHYNKPDIIVSYILLVGAIVLDLLPALTSIVSSARKPFRPGTVANYVWMSVVRCIQPQGWLTTKQWLEELQQYSMIRIYSTSVEDQQGCMPSVWKWILKCKPFHAWYAEFFDLSSTSLTDDLKLFVLDKLLFLQTRRQEWDFANFRGQRALGKWMDSHRDQVLDPESSSYAALHNSLSSMVEFPTSVLMWHIATEICYFCKDSGHGTENEETTTKSKQRSRVLSQYIMYLFFKCDVMLTSKSRLLHYRSREGFKQILLDQSAMSNLDEKKAAIKVFGAAKEEDQKQGSTSSSGSGTQEALQSTADAALFYPVLPRARAVAQELIDIDDEAQRWHLISEVLLEMLFYTAPRCGPDFHYEHLSTGGEFISHVLILMRSLGPFMPKSGA